MIGPFILQRHLRNSFLDERIISCHFKIIGLFSCKRYIGKFLIVENLIYELYISISLLDILFFLVFSRKTSTVAAQSEHKVNIIFV